MFAIALELIPLIPSLIRAGEATFETWQRIERAIREDRSLTADERAQLEALIAEKKAIVDDTSRDV